jgi:hypothetical protein
VLHVISSRGFTDGGFTDHDGDWRLRAQARATGSRSGRGRGPCREAAVSKPCEQWFGSDVLIFTLLLLVMCDCMRRADKNMARGFNYLTSTLAYIASCRVSKLVAVVGPDTYGQRSLACLREHTFAVFLVHSLILADSQLLQRISTLVRFCAGSTRFLPILRQLAVTSRPTVISHAKGFARFQYHLGRF